MQDPSFSQSLARFGCFCGTFRPSLLHILSTLLWFTFQPSCLSSAVILRYPYLPYCVVSSIIRATSLSSSLLICELCLCVVLAWLKTRHARLSETLRVLKIVSTILCLFNGLRSFPGMPPWVLHYLAGGLLRVSWAGYSPSQVLWVVWPARFSSHHILFASDNKSVRSLLFSSQLLLSLSLEREGLLLPVACW